MPGFAATPAGKKRTEKTIRRIDIYEDIRYASYCKSTTANAPLFNKKVITNTSLTTQNLFDKGTKTTEASR